MATATVIPDWQAYEDLKRSFRCSHCHAGPDQRCTAKNGSPAGYDHAARSNAAWSLIGFAADPPTQQLETAARLAEEWRQ